MIRHVVRRDMLGKQFLSLPYASANALQVLDVLLPTVGAPPWPCVFFLHGGGWQGGTKAFGAGEAPLRCLENGIAVVSADYRLTPTHRWPVQMYDAKAALRWTRANARRFGLHGGRLGAWGPSAGGHMAAILAATPGVSSLRDASLGNSGVSEAVSCCISWFAPTHFKEEDADFTTQVAEGGPTMNRAGVSAVCSTSSQEYDLLNVNPCSASDAVHDAASVVYWIANATSLPPFRIQHGVHNAGVGGDRTIPIPQARRFKAALEARGRSFSIGRDHYSEESGLPHSIGHPLWQTTTITDPVIAWLHAHL